MSLTYAGVNSDAVNIVVERYPARPIPGRRYNVQTVPGRSGSLLLDEEAYNNIDQEYEIYIRSVSGSTFQTSCRMAAEWLLLPAGYQKLYDSYDPDTFRYGYFVGPRDVSNALNQLGRATIKFSCKPYRYLVSGEVVQTIAAASATLVNPSLVPAEPYIVVHGSGAGTIGVGSYTITISDIADGMVIDSEVMDCYLGTVNKNSLITLSPTFTYPKLVAGANTITLGGGVLSLEIKPRWRSL